MDCLEEQGLLDFLAGRLDGARTTSARAHLARCTGCKQVATALIRDVVDNDDEASPSPPALEGIAFEPGALVGGRYRLEGRVGEGAMGIVWRARSLKDDRAVAIKFLKAFDLDARRRFVREVSVARALRHDNLVQVLDVLEDVEAGCPALVMELLVGEGLDVRLARGPLLGERELVELASGVARALDVVHRAGVLHRDLKPANVFVDESGAIKVLDLGLAAVSSQCALPLTTRITRTGHAVGTPRYMAPEQLGGARQLDARVDVYALGAVLYECSTGAPPFDGVTLGDLLRSMSRGRPSPAPGRLGPLVDAMLAHDPRDRPNSMKSVLESAAAVGCHTPLLR